MGSLSTGLRHEMKRNTPFSQLTSSGCHPSFNVKKNGADRFAIGCDYSNGIAYESILKTKPSVVILGAANKHDLYDWEVTVAALHKMGVPKVLIIGPFPQWKPSLPLVYVNRHMGKEYITDRAFNQSLLNSNDYLIDLDAKSENFIYY